MIILPPKPGFHPNDSFRAMQSKLDAFYADLERIFQTARKLVHVGDQSNGWWYDPESVTADITADATLEGLLIGVKQIAITDDELIRRLELKDPHLAKRLRERLRDQQ